MEQDGEILALLERGDREGACEAVLAEFGPALLEELRALAPHEAEEVFVGFAERLWVGLVGWRGNPPLSLWTRQLLRAAARDRVLPPTCGQPMARLPAAEALEALDQAMGGGFFPRVARPGPEILPPPAPPGDLPDLTFLHVRKLRRKKR